MSIQITGGAAGLPLSGGTLTGPLEIAVGSAAAPGLAVAGDSNTGLWAPAADVLAISTGGVERVRVSSALEIFGVNGAAGISVRLAAYSNNEYFAVAPGAPTKIYSPSSDFQLGQNIATGVYLNRSTGAIGIGTATPTAALHVPASTTARASLRIPAGTAPTIPNAGDIWAVGAVLKFFDGTTTKEIAFV